MGQTSKLLLSAAVIVLAGTTPALSAWQPQKPIEFVATAGPGGGTDNLARAVQNIITKHKLVEQPIVVVNKGGGSGAEGYVYGKASAGDPYKVIFGTSNAWQQPLVSKVAFNYTDLTPIAAMAQDEFLLWVKQDAPYKTAGDYLKAAASGEFKMGGAQSKDTDEVLTRMIEKAGHIKLTYIPFKKRRRDGRATRRRTPGLSRQQSQRESRAMAWRHPAPALRLQPEAAAAGRQGHRDRRLGRCSDLRRAGPRHQAV
ncbi:tripartite-type tricarboxylate transporter receptor subunit TctC [Bradyrhizobium sp. GM0.4]